MDNNITSINDKPVRYPEPQPKPKLMPRDLTVQRKQDILDLSGGKISSQDAQKLVYDKAIERLRAVVSDAKSALNIPENAQLDTSPEATADRIANFALRGFSVFQKNHTDLSEEDARAAYVKFIGGAIEQGISEARKVLTGLQALSPEIDTNIDTTFKHIQDRLNDFAANGPK